VKQSMLKALGNVAPRHLLDTRLNPPAALRARPDVAQALRSAGPEVAQAFKPADRQIGPRPTIQLRSI